jgi:hypothetical protein
MRFSNGPSAIESLLLLALLTFGALLPASASAEDVASKQPGIVTVEVSGYGSTVEDARIDVVRQAMQAAVAQLVVSDISISGDEILKDRVVSTMNGFVDDIDELRIERSGEEVEVTSRVTVSTQRISAFVGGDVNASGVDGMSLFGEVAREKAQREAAAEIIARSFRGFPARALKTTVTAVRPSISDPDILELDVEVQADPAWVRSVEDVMAALATKSVVLPAGNRHGPTDCRNNLLDTKLVPTVCGGGSRLDDFAAAAADRKRLTGSNSETLQSAPICVVSDQGGRCYQLPIADYSGFMSDMLGGGLTPEAASLGFLFVPLDKQGKLVDSARCCDVVGASAGSLSDGYDPFGTRGRALSAPAYFPVSQYSRASGRHLMSVNYIYSGVVRTKVLIGTSQFDLAATDRVVLVAMLNSSYGDSAAVWDLADGNDQASSEEIVARVVEEAAVQRR